MVVWGITIAAALAVSLVVYQFTKPAPSSVAVGYVVYAGEQMFTPEEFTAFKNYAGSSTLIHIEQLDFKDGKVKYRLVVPEGESCPYGDYKGKVSGSPVELVPVAYAVASFAGVFVLGAWIVNFRRLGFSWRRGGRH